mmetsp:Transcript_36609/g.112811  ORF Transcript_36609/g.112811 Transcript_36609/m.112811 type:complete len:327 (-) Transcript_36609:38-1018(-)
MRQRNLNLLLPLLGLHALGRLALDLAAPDVLPVGRQHRPVRLGERLDHRALVLVAAVGVDLLEERVEALVAAEGALLGLLLLLQVGLELGPVAATRVRVRELLLRLRQRGHRRRGGRGGRGLGGGLPLELDRRPVHPLQGLVEHHLDLGLLHVDLRAGGVDLAEQRLVGQLELLVVVELDGHLDGALLGVDRHHVRRAVLHVERVRDGRWRLEPLVAARRLRLRRRGRGRRGRWSRSRSWGWGRGGGRGGGGDGDLVRDLLQVRVALADEQLQRAQRRGRAVGSGLVDSGLRSSLRLGELVGLEEFGRRVERGLRVVACHGVNGVG